MAFKPHIYERTADDMTIDELITQLQRAKKMGVSGDTKLTISVKNIKNTDEGHYSFGGITEVESGVREHKKGKWERVFVLRGVAADD